jgi:hypothetical protein
MDNMSNNKLDSPPPRKSPNSQHDEQQRGEHAGAHGQPENLSMKRPDSSPAINLVSCCN